MESYSQHGEDVFISNLLIGDYAPFMVDVGANDGYSWSNSHSFIGAGFSALLIEPMPRFADYCRARYHENPKVFVEQVAILPTFGKLKFYINNDIENDLLAMSSGLKRELIRGNDVTEVEVLTSPLEFLLFKYKVPKDYAILNVDAEGVDLEVLESANLDQYRPLVICVEFGLNKDNVHRFLVDKQYALCKELGANGIYRRLT